MGEEIRDEISSKHGKKSKLWIRIPLIVLICAFLGFLVYWIIIIRAAVLDQSRKIQIQKGFDINAGVYENASVFKRSMTEDYRYLFNDPRFEHVSYEYIMGLGIESGANRAMHDHIEFIDNSDYCRKQLDRMNIYGAYPCNAREIVLAYDSAKQLFPDTKDKDILGRTVRLKYRDVYEDVTVVGINRSKDASGHEISYIPIDMISLLSDILKNSEFRDQTYLFTDRFFSEHPELFSGSSYNIGFSRLNCMKANELEGSKLIWGRNAEREGEIVLELGTMRNDPVCFDVVGKSEDELREYAKSLLGMEVACGSSGHYVLKYKIVGIADDSGEENEKNCYLTLNDMESMTQLAPSRINIVIRDSKMVKQIKEELENMGFTVY